MNNSKNLDKQLLPGLKTEKFHNPSKNSIKPFMYNDINSLKKFLKKEIIILE